jgi:hypothetical protein
MAKSHPEMLAPLDQAFLSASVALRQAVDRARKWGRVWSIAGSSVFGAIVGGVIGVVIYYMFINNSQRLIFIMLGIIPSGGLFGFSTSLGIGVGTVFGRHRKSLSIIGGVLGAILPSLLLGPAFGTSTLLGAIIGGVYGGSIALIVIIGRLFKGIKQIVILAALSMLISWLAGEFFQEPISLFLMTLGVTTGISYNNNNS